MTTRIRRHVEAVAEIRNLKRRCAIASHTFCPGVGQTDRQAEADSFIQEAFDCWWETWIEPQLRIVEGLD